MKKELTKREKEVLKEMVEENSFDFLTFPKFPNKTVEEHVEEEIAKRAEKFKGEFPFDRDDFDFKTKTSLRGNVLIKIFLKEEIVEQIKKQCAEQKKEEEK